MFGIVWALAIAGVLKDTLLHGRYRPISVVLYILMGWLVIVAIKPLKLAMPPNGIAWIAAGGVVYMAGLIFFALSKRVAHMHGVWHLCVIGGSAAAKVMVQGDPQAKFMVSPALAARIAARSEFGGGDVALSAELVTVIVAAPT